MTEQPPPYDPNAQGQQPPQGWAPQQPQQPGWTPPPGYGYPAPAPQTPGSATTALILGILGLVMCGIFTSLPAIFVGRNAMKEIDASNGQLGGRSTANAGYILGIVGTIVWGLGLLVLGALLVFGLLAADSIDCTSTNSGDAYSFDCS